jgi:hypothetical protein
MMIQSDELHYFFQGVAQPPIRWWLIGYEAREQYLAGLFGIMNYSRETNMNQLV